MLKQILGLIQRNKLKSTIVSIFIILIFFYFIKTTNKNKNNTKNKLEKNLLERIQPYTIEDMTQTEDIEIWIQGTWLQNKIRAIAISFKNTEKEKIDIITNLVNLYHKYQNDFENTVITEEILTILQILSQEFMTVFKKDIIENKNINTNSLEINLEIIDIKWNLYDDKQYTFITKIVTEKKEFNEEINLYYSIFLNDRIELTGTSLIALGKLTALQNKLPELVKLVLSPEQYKKFVPYGNASIKQIKSSMSLKKPELKVYCRNLKGEELRKELYNELKKYIKVETINERLSSLKTVKEEITELQKYLEVAIIQSRMTKKNSQ